MKLENLIAIDILLSHSKADEGIKNLQKEFSNLKKSVNSVDDQSNLEKMGNKFQAMGSQISYVGNTLTKFIAVPLVGALGASVKAATEYELAFSGVEKKVSGTEQELKDLDMTIRDMATRMPAQAKDIAKVFEIGGTLGIGIDSIEKFSDVMIKMGVTTSLSSEAAAESFARLFNIMGTTDDNYERFGNTINKLGKTSATNETDIMNMTLRLAAAGKQAGMSEVEVAAIATTLSSLGINAAAGGSSMSKFIANMNVAVSVGTGKMRDLEKQTGKTWREMEIMSANSGKEFKALASSIGIPSTELKRFVDAGKNAQQMADVAGVSVDKFAEIFRNNATDGIAMFIEGLANAQDGLKSTTLSGEDAITILNEMGLSEIRLRDTLLRTSSAQDLFNKSLKTGNDEWEHGNSLTDDANIRYQTLSAQWDILKNTIQVIGINLGEQMLPYLKDAVKWLQGFADGIAKMKPEEFKRIVDSIIKLVGGILAIKGIGKVTSAMGSIMTMVGKVQSSLGGLQGATDGLSQSYIDGGWTSAAVKGLEKLGYAMRENGTMGNGARQAFASLEKEAKFLGKTVGEVTKSTISLKDVGNHLMGSPMFKVAGWTAIAGYAVNTVNKFINLGDAAGVAGSGIGSIVKPVKDFVGAMDSSLKSVTNGTAGIADLGAAFGGLLLMLNPLTMPMGIALTTIGAINVGLGLLVGGVNKTSDTLVVSKKAISEYTKAWSTTETTFDKVIKEKQPELTAALDNINDKVRRTKLFPDVEEAKTTIEDYTSFVDLATSTIVEGYYKARDSITDVIKNSVSMTKEEKEQEIAYWERATDKSIEEADRLREEINALSARKHDENKSWTAKDEEELQRHLTRLAEITMLHESEQLNKEVERMRSNALYKRSIGEQLSQEELESVIKSVSDKHTALQEITNEGYATELQALERQLADKNLTQAEYDEKLKKMHQRRWDDDKIRASTAAKEYLGIITGMKEDELNEAIEQVARLEEVNRTLEKNSGANWHNLTIEQRNGLNKEKEQLDERLKNLNLNSDAIKGIMDIMKVYMPESMQDAVFGMTKETDMTGVLQAFGKFDKEAMDIIKRTSEKIPEEMGKGIERKKRAASTQYEAMHRDMESKSLAFVPHFEYLGGEIIGGQIRGLNSRKNELLRAMHSIQNDVYDRTKRVNQIMSPSRRYAKLFEFIPEGMAVGLKKGSKYAIDAMEELNEDVANASNIDADFQVNGGATVRKMMEVSAESSFVESLRGAIIGAFGEAGPITAYIGKDEAKENFELNLSKALAGNYK